MAEPVLLEVRERRSRFGRAVKWAFWVFQPLMLLLTLGTCAAVTPYVAGPDPEVALGAGMFGAMAIGTLWTLWPLGTLVLGVLLLADPGTEAADPGAAGAGGHAGTGGRRAGPAACRRPARPGPALIGASSRRAA